MASPLRLGAPALLLTAALVGGTVSVASADEPTVDPAVLTLGTPDVLTLPAKDGVRDETPVTLSSSVPTTVGLQVLSADRATVYATLPSFEFTADTLTTSVTVPVTDLVAGNLLLEATPASGDAVSVPLTVGSGEPTNVSLALSRSTIFTWSKSTARTTTATVTARDETGLAVPFRATVTAKIGSTARSAAVTSAGGAAVAASFSASSLPVGTGTVVATATGPAKVGHASPAAKLTVSTVSLKSTKLAASAGSIYPAKDGYRDSSKLTLTSATTTGAAIPVTGTVKITRGGKTVKTYKLSSSKTWSLTWNGKIGSKIVYGKYKITATVKGPQGGAKTSSATITVAKGKLVTKTKTTTVSANSVFSSYYTFDEDAEGYCQEYTSLGYLNCIGYDAFYDDTLSLLATGGVTVPSVVVNAQKYGGAKVRLTLSATDVYGAAAWGYGPSSNPAAKVTTMREGKSTPGWLSLPAATKRVAVSAALSEYTFFWADKIKIEYSYKVMQK